MLNFFFLKYNFLFSKHQINYHLSIWREIILIVEAQKSPNRDGSAAQSFL